MRVSWWHSSGVLRVAHPCGDVSDRETGASIGLVGPFRTTHRMTLLDPTARSLHEPSIYDQGRQHGRIGVRFLRAFAGEIALPVRRSASPRYIPTQLVTEYVRTELAATTGAPVDGIVFPSSCVSGDNVVLFVGSECCSDLGSERQLLALDRERIRVLAPFAARQIWRVRQHPRAETLRPTLSRDVAATTPPWRRLQSSRHLTKPDERRSL